MFTGIVEETGQITAVEADSDGQRLRISTDFEGLFQGQSISVSGVCLTVEAFGEDYFDVFLAAETRERTYLGDIEEGAIVNLERALPANGRFDGHIVQGHVDGTGEILEIIEVGEDWEFRFRVPKELSQYIVEKGSIAIDGVSLTVASLQDQTLSVAIVPESYAVTNFSEKSPGDPVHLEVDVVAKYVEKLVEGYR